MKHRITAFAVRRALRGRRPGAVLAVVAVSLVALVSVIALAIDIGMLYSGRTEAQRVADAAALAGASAFQDFDPITQPGPAWNQAQTRAMDYATRGQVLNTQVAASEVEVQILLNIARVRVFITRPAVPLIFARVFGVQTSGIAAMAAAEAVNAGSASCVKPFAIPDLWGAPTPAQDIYTRPNQAPVWDFDAHLLPNQSIIDSGHCSRQGNRWVCPPETWSPQGVTGYTNGQYGYGTDARNGAQDYMGRSYTKDEGRRVPMKINFPNDGGVPSFWFPWRLPGSAGTADLVSAIRGCVSDVQVGQGVTTETGMASNPIYNAFINLIDNGNGNGPPDRYAYWDEATNQVVNSAYEGNIKASPRVVTVAIVNPETVANGMNTMTFVDFATFFLEDPRVIYPDVNPAHHAPITGRLIRFGSGQAGPQQGNLIRMLRLVE